MKLSTFSERFDQLLATDDYAEVDGSPNGLQVGDGDMSVSHAAFAVDAAQVTIDAAADMDADVLVTHHGLWWEGTDRITQRTYDRVAGLIEHGLGLYVSHLPLDGHSDLGNAAGIAGILGLEDCSPFGQLGDVTIGQQGRLPDPQPVSAVANTLKERLSENVHGVRTLDHGPADVEDIAIVTGSGVDWLDEAIGQNIDLLITGEGKQSVYHQAREAGINVILGEHYATETFGVQSLQEVANEWGLSTAYIEHPTGL